MGILLSVYSSALKFTKSMGMSSIFIIAVSKCFDWSGLLWITLKLLLHTPILSLYLTINSANSLPMQLSRAISISSLSLPKTCFWWSMNCLMYDVMSIEGTLSLTQPPATRNTVFFFPKSFTFSKNEKIFSSRSVNLIWGATTSIWPVGDGIISSSDIFLVVVMDLKSLDGELYRGVCCACLICRGLTYLRHLIRRSLSCLISSQKNCQTTTKARFQPQSSSSKLFRIIFAILQSITFVYVLWFILVRV